VIGNAPIWNADGSRVAFLRDPDEPGKTRSLVSLRADGTGAPETMLETDITFFLAMNRDWSIAAYMTGAAGNDNGFAISTVQFADPSSEKVFVDGPTQDAAPAIHPNGNWVAYMTGDFPSLDIVVRPFPEGEGQWKVGVSYGGVPTWSPDGRRLYFTKSVRRRGITRSVEGQQNYLMEATFDGSDSRPVLGQAVELFEIQETSLAVTGDGRFIFIVDEEPGEGEEVPHTNGMILVENWLSRFSE
jgi:hypothetical protein